MRKRPGTPTAEPGPAKRPRVGRGSRVDRERSTELAPPKEQPKATPRKLPATAETPQTAKAAAEEALASPDRVARLIEQAKKHRQRIAQEKQPLLDQAQPPLATEEDSCAACCETFTRAATWRKPGTLPPGIRPYGSKTCSDKCRRMHRSGSSKKRSKSWRRDAGGDDTTCTRQLFLEVAPDELPKCKKADELESVAPDELPKCKKADELESRGVVGDAMRMAKDAGTTAARRFSSTCSAVWRRREEPASSQTLPPLRKASPLSTYDSMTTTVHLYGQKEERRSVAVVPSRPDLGVPLVYGNLSPQFDAEGTPLPQMWNAASFFREHGLDDRELSFTERSTEREVAELLSKFRPEVLVVDAHSTDLGGSLLTSGPDKVTAVRLGAVLGAGVPQRILQINACCSMAFEHALAAPWRIAVLWEGPVSSAATRVFSEAFWHKLLRGDRVATAWEAGIGKIRELRRTTPTLVARPRLLSKIDLDRSDTWSSLDRAPKYVTGRVFGDEANFGQPQVQVIKPRFKVVKFEDVKVEPRDRADGETSDVDMEDVEFVLSEQVLRTSLDHATALSAGSRASEMTAFAKRHGLEVRGVAGGRKKATVWAEILQGLRCAGLLSRGP